MRLSTAFRAMLAIAQVARPQLCTLSASECCSNIVSLKKILVSLTRQCSCLVVVGHGSSIHCDEVVEKQQARVWLP